jgi:ABC-type dipeptide/oligopeptide/nickel transport system permease subunit
MTARAITPIDSAAVDSNADHAALQGRVMVATRALWLAAGLLVAARALLELFEPQYWRPVTPLDHMAVWLGTAAWLLVGPSMLLLARLSGSRVALVVGAVVATAAVLVGVANALEDGFGLRAFGDLFVGGAMAFVVSMPILVVALLLSRQRRLALPPAVFLAGFATFTPPGALLALAALAVPALVPAWFLRVGGERSAGRRVEPQPLNGSR